jgi:hypothetical protein
LGKFVPHEIAPSADTWIGVNRYGAARAESEGRQTPWLSRNLMIGDFDIF